MAVEWKKYELVLEESDSKECEVTGRDMGGTQTHVCPVAKMKKNSNVMWEPAYGGYHAVKVTFLDTDDEAVHLHIYNGYDIDKYLKPGEEWNSGWYSFGSWNYYVAIRLKKTASHEDLDHE